MIGHRFGRQSGQDESSGRNSACFVLLFSVLRLSCCFESVHKHRISQNYIQWEHNNIDIDIINVWCNADH